MNSELLSEILFPSGCKCLICGTEIAKGNFDVCGNCYVKLPFITGKVCVGCGEPLYSMSDYCLNCKNTKRYFTSCYAPFTFTDDVVRLIHGLKYGGKKYVATTLSNFLLKHFSEKNLSVDVVIPIPLHAARFKERGFNQSELLTQSFSKFGFNVNCDCLVRSKDTSTQTNLSKTERLQNVTNAFRCVNKDAIKNKTVLLIDDVYTTGATFNEASRVLISAGAKQVYCLSVAHTILNKA